jgi:hypothetical protein
MRFSHKIAKLLNRDACEQSHSAETHSLESKSFYTQILSLPISLCRVLRGDDAFQDARTASFCGSDLGLAGALLRALDTTT